MAPPSNETEDTEVPYEHVPGLGYYKVYGANQEDRKNWTSAQEVCRKDDAHLLVINSEHEAASVERVIEKFGTTYFFHFIGITEGGTGIFMTIFSKFRYIL